MPDFLPRAGAALLAWSRSFDEIINSDPEHFQLSEEQAAHYSDLHAQFAQAFGKSAAPGSRCPALTVAKDQRERALRSFARALAAVIRTSPQIPDADKVRVGVPPPKKTRTRISTPSRAPVLSLSPSLGYRPMLFLTDPEIPKRIAKPRNALGAMVLYFVGEEYPSDLKAWTVHGQITRTRATLNLPAHLSPGTKVWIKARYYNPAGRHGPWSQPVHTHIGYGEGSVPRLAA